MEKQFHLLISNYKTKTGYYIRKTDQFNRVQITILWVKKQNHSEMTSWLARNLQYFNKQDITKKKQQWKNR